MAARRPAPDCPARRLAPDPPAYAHDSSPPHHSRELGWFAARAFLASEARESPSRSPPPSPPSQDLQCRPGPPISCHLSAHLEPAPSAFKVPDPYPCSECSKPPPPALCFDRLFLSPRSVLTATASPRLARKTGCVASIDPPSAAIANPPFIWCPPLLDVLETDGCDTRARLEAYVIVSTNGYPACADVGVAHSWVLFVAGPMGTLTLAVGVLATVRTPLNTGTELTVWESFSFFQYSGRGVWVHWLRLCRPAGGDGGIRAAVFMRCRSVECAMARRGWAADAQGPEGVGVGGPIIHTSGDVLAPKVLAMRTHSRLGAARPACGVGADQGDVGRERVEWCPGHSQPELVQCIWSEDSPSMHMQPFLASAVHAGGSAVSSTFAMTPLSNGVLAGTGADLTGRCYQCSLRAERGNLPLMWSQLRVGICAEGGCSTRLKGVKISMPLSMEGNAQMWTWAETYAIVWCLWCTYARLYSPTTVTAFLE
ncbi:hypothetical protein C8F04DRAFT_1191660 [Mycena alexandri]|uniref:Uncharacterized protein n=1 Tax=Mycena alexandri TaxID=1745969 RepID=A0AAD6WXX8_9AGAR|nr:hypothetical protein C8F04DRAFT_1191660 [Mycena alexandri]